MFPGSDWSAHREHLTDDGKVLLSFGSFLVRSGGRSILVDLALGTLNIDVPGLGHLEGGALVSNLAKLGLAPDDIDTVLYTHMHLDHVGWTSDVAPNPAAPSDRTPRRLTFANARHLVSEPEWRHWNDHHDGPDPVAVLAPLAERIEFVTDGQEIMPGITIRVSPGHSPGHLEVVVTDATGGTSDALVLIGDLLHNPAQITDPAMPFASEYDAAAALAVRRRLLDSAPLLVGAQHFAGQVFGRIVPSPRGPFWEPIEP